MQENDQIKWTFMYLLEISDNYPESYWLEYDSKSFPDPLLLKEGQAVNISDFSDVHFKVKPKVSIEKVLKYDYLFSSGIDIISEKLAKILVSFNEKIVQLIPTKIEYKDILYDGFYIVNYLMVKNAFDLEKSECVPLIKLMPDGPKKYTKIVLVKSDKQSCIFRAKEDLFEIVATDDLVEKIENANIKGIQFVKEKSRF